MEGKISPKAPKRAPKRGPKWLPNGTFWKSADVTNHMVFTVLEAHAASQKGFRKASQKRRDSGAASKPDFSPLEFFLVDFGCPLLEVITSVKPGMSVSPRGCSFGGGEKADRQHRSKAVWGGPPAEAMGCPIGAGCAAIE